MLITYVVVNKATGEIEDNCEHCGIYHVTGLAGYSAHTIPDDHDKAIVQRAIDTEASQYDFEKKTYHHKIDIKNRRLIRKGKETDSGDR